MVTRTSVALTDDLARAWKTSGATLVDLITRGLKAETADSTSAPPSTTPRTDEALTAALAAIEQRLTAIEQTLGDRLPPVSGTEYEATRQQHTRERAHAWHRRLYEATHGKPFTTAQAATILECVSSTTAGGYLRMMAAMDLARQVENRGSSHQWQVKRPPRAADEAGQAHQGQETSAA